MNTAFTMADIEKAHAVVDPDGVNDYLTALRQLGVAYYVSHICDGHSDFYDAAGNKLSTAPIHDRLTVAERVDPKAAKLALGQHGRGETDYLTFARQLADAGIETWLMDPRARTCTFCCRAGEKLFSAPL
ncbi:DUF1398 family protein [Pseudooceanicola nanhaiensis]|uniref:DUF1398 family protein n=1 Tax=Pseudooceanicola nanhaiensis TaxID=375761 RepID=UPI0035162BA0